MTAPADSLEVRSRLLEDLKLDLVGPWVDHELVAEQLPGRERPSNWYVAGFLIPTGTPPDRSGDVDEDDDLDTVPESAGLAEESNDERKAARKAFFPSSMGLRFLVAGTCRQLAVTVRWSDYASADIEEEDGSKTSVWQRTPREAALSIPLGGDAGPVVRDVAGSDGLQLHVAERSVDAAGLTGAALPAGTRSVSCFLVNRRAPDEAQPDRAYAFQAEIEVRTGEGFVPRPDLRAAHAGEWDDRVADLHYADTPEYATGHGVSAEWDLVDGECRSIRTAWIGTAEVEKTATANVPGVGLSMEALGRLADGTAAEQALSPLVARYHEWIEARRQEITSGPWHGDRRDTAAQLLHDARIAADRIVRGVALLGEDADLLDVRGCPRGHVDDLDWRRFVHRRGSECPPTRPLWLDEQGTTGDLTDLVVRCECGATRRLSDASMIEINPLGTCRGARPWLGRDTNEDCNQPSRLLVRTASNAWFAQVLSVLSIPERGAAVETVVRELWDDLQIVNDAAGLAFIKGKPKVAAALAPFDDDEVLAAIGNAKGGGAGSERSVKEIELEAILAAPEGFGDDVPVNPDFHARRLPDVMWRRSERAAGVEAVIQLHRLREVMALAGFTRFEAVTPDIHGDYETDVERAAIALEPSWFPAVENRGEGLFLRLRTDAVEAWRTRPAVRDRLDGLVRGHLQWAEKRKSARSFPGGPYVLLHTLSHLLIQSFSMQCGYPASSLRERIYAEEGRYGLLIYTGSPDAEGTLGGLVQQARRIDEHLTRALEAGGLCSNDPTCAEHAPGDSMSDRFLHGAACHGCALVAETSCEMRNDHLERALVVPVLGMPDAAFFGLAG